MPPNPYRKQPNINDMMYPKGSKQPRQVWAAVMNVYKAPVTTPQPTPSPTGTANPTPTPTNTPTGTAAVTPTPTPSGTAAITPSPTQTQTGTPQVTSTPTPTPTQLPGTAEANTYLSAVVSAGGTGITAPVSAATITMFQSIWSNGLNTDMLAMYPFIGGTAGSHKFNGMNPLDTDGAYRLTFAGGWTHSASGATPNGTNGVAETYLQPNATSFTISGGSMGVYCGTNGPSGAVMGGIGNSGGADVDGWVLYPGLTSPGTLQEGCFFWKSSSGVFNGSAIADTLGLMSIGRTGTTQVQLYRRGVLLSSPAFASNSVTNNTLALGARNTLFGTPAEYSTYRQQFTYIHRGLTPTQMTTLDGIIQTYQTSLGRNVY
jgi:hypothetical protein